MDPPLLLQALAFGSIRHLPKIDVRAALNLFPKVITLAKSHAGWTVRVIHNYSLCLDQAGSNVEAWHTVPSGHLLLDVVLALGDAQLEDVMVADIFTALYLEKFPSPTDAIPNVKASGVATPAISDGKSTTDDTKTVPAIITSTPTEVCLRQHLQSAIRAIMRNPDLAQWYHQHSAGVTFITVGHDEETIDPKHAFLGLAIDGFKMTPDDKSSKPDRKARECKMPPMPSLPGLPSASPGQSVVVPSRPLRDAPARSSAVVQSAPVGSRVPMRHSCSACAPSGVRAQRLPSPAITERILCLAKHAPLYWALPHINKFYMNLLENIVPELAETRELLELKIAVTLPKGLQLDDVKTMTPKWWKVFCAPDKLRAYLLGYPIHLGMPSARHVRNTIFRRISEETTPPKSAAPPISISLSPHTNDFKISNSEDLLGEMWSSYNPFDCLGYVEDEHYFVFTRPSWVNLLKDPKNPYTKQYLQQPFLDELKQRMKMTADLPPSAPLAELLGKFEKDELDHPGRPQNFVPIHAPSMVPVNDDSDDELLFEVPQNGMGYVSGPVGQSMIRTSVMPIQYER